MMVGKTPFFFLWVFNKNLGLTYLKKKSETQHLRGHGQLLSH